jgi:streptogramin lyase
LTDSAPLLRGIAVDGAGSAYVADAGQGTIWRLRPGTAIEPWYSSAEVQGEQGLAGMAFDARGHLLAAVTRLAGLQATGAGALLRIEHAADGSAGARTVLSAFRAGDDPVDVAVGSSGRSYVPLRGVDALVVLDAEGRETLRVVDDALSEPAAVELVAGRVLVAVHAPRPAVLAVGAADRPLPPPARTRPPAALGGRAHG